MAPARESLLVRGSCRAGPAGMGPDHRPTRSRPTGRRARGLHEHDATAALERMTYIEPEFRFSAEGSVLT